MYRMLLWLAFPRRLRRIFGDDMTRLFNAQREEVRARGGSMMRLWADAVRDALLQGTAERLKQIEHGGLAVARELRRWRWWIRAFIQDVRYAARLTFKQPGVTIVTILTLALGIGANTAIFSAVDAVLLRPLPYPEADQLVKVWEKRQREGVLNNVVAPADFIDWSRMNGAFEAMAAVAAATVDLTGSGEPVRLMAAAVSTPFFDVLRVSPVIGRGFRPEEGKVGQHRVVVLNHGLWGRRFGSDPSIVGQKIVLNGIPHDVIGVLPRSFEFPDRTIELWSPLAFEGAVDSPPRTNHFLEVYARLKPEVSLERARADMDRVGAELSRQYPEANQNHGAHVAPLHEDSDAHGPHGTLASTRRGRVRPAHRLRERIEPAAREGRIATARDGGSRRGRRRPRAARRPVADRKPAARNARGRCRSSGGQVGHRRHPHADTERASAARRRSSRRRPARPDLHAAPVTRHGPAVWNAPRVASRESGPRRITQGRCSYFRRRASPDTAGSGRGGNRARVHAARLGRVDLAQLSDPVTRGPGHHDRPRADGIGGAAEQSIRQRREAGDGVPGDRAAARHDSRSDGPLVRRAASLWPQKTRAGASSSRDASRRVPMRRHAPIHERSPATTSGPWV